MNSELLLRLSQIKTYISSLNDSLSVNNHTNAVAVVSKFKKAMSKSEEHVHASQFVLDCLRTRNEKLRTELFDMEQEKKSIENKLAAAKNAPREIRETKADICITRLTLSLAESKKVDYEEVNLRSDYQHVFVNSVLGEKYRNHPISIEEAQQLEQRGNLLYFCVIGEQVFHIIIRFRSEKDAYRWTTCLRHALMTLKNAKKKDRLFEQQKEMPPPPPPASIPVTTINNSINPPPLRTSMAKSSLGVPTIPFLNFASQGRTISPSESGISDKKFTDKSYQRDADKSGQKNTERSLVNALNYESVQSSGTFNIKEQTQPMMQSAAQSYERRIDLNRPPTLTKVRNNSNHDYSSTVDTLKAFKSGFRKQSEDIKPHINQVYHQKMMQNYRSQEEQQEVKSESTFRLPEDKQKTAKLRSLQQKKKELLKQPHHLSIDKPAFAFDNKVTWMGIEQMEDQNKSKSSNRISNKSRRGSQFSQSVIAGSSQQPKRETAVQDNHSEHITEKSQEESPKLPKHPTYEVPTKISYANGIVFQLHQVEKGGTSPLLPPKPDTPERPIRPSSSSSLDSDDDDHSDPSSHENHTESEDNNTRSEQLKKGIILTKCSENGFWTHEKILYLSQNNNELCSRDLKDKKIKKIKIANIKDVQYKKFDKGIIKHVNKIEQDKCFVIRALDDEGKIKNYEFVGNLAEPLERFANSLKLFVDYAKRE